MCRITKVNPHSAYAYIEDYGVEGLIHISEVASGWVKDIRDNLKEGQLVAALVLNVNERMINLSIKRVSRNQRKNKLKEFKKEKGAEKALQLIAKSLKASRRFQSVKEKLKENFGSVRKAFEMSLRNEDALKGIVTDRWIEEMKKVAEKMIKKREIEVKMILKLKSYEGDGVEKIRSTLKSIESLGLNVKYISAPNYMIRFKVKDKKSLERKVDEVIEKIEKLAKSQGCFDSIEVVE